MNSKDNAGFKINEKLVLRKFDGDPKPEDLPVEVIIAEYEGETLLCKVTLTDPEAIKQFEEREKNGSK